MIFRRNLTATTSQKHSLDGRLPTAISQPLTAIVQRYPVTIVMLAPYICLILPQSIFYGNPQTGFLFWLVGLAVLGAAGTETTFALVRPSYKTSEDMRAAHSRFPQIMKTARVISGISIAADVINAWFGGGTVFTQVSGQAASSPLVSLTSLINSWKYLAVGLLFSALLGKAVRPAIFYRWLAALIAGQVFVTSLTARTQPVIGFMTFIALFGLIMGVVKIRFMAVGVVGLLLIWPTVFEIRNQIRKEGGVAVSDQVSASDRLRFDLQISGVSKFKVPAPVVGVPQFSDVLRYGLVPRVLDPDRPLLSTGARINSYLGGDETSSYTFLPLGTIYFLDGPYGVVVFFAVWAFGVLLLLRTGSPGPGPVRLCLFSLAVAGPLGWTSTYPDSLIGLVQSLISALPPLFLLLVWRKRARKEWVGSYSTSFDDDVTQQSFLNDQKAAR